MLASPVSPGTTAVRLKSWTLRLLAGALLVFLAFGQHGAVGWLGTPMQLFRAPALRGGKPLLTADSPPDGFLWGHDSREAEWAPAETAKAAAQRAAEAKDAATKAATDAGEEASAKAVAESMAQWQTEAAESALAAAQKAAEEAKAAEEKAQWLAKVAEEDAAQMRAWEAAQPAEEMAYSRAGGDAPFDDVEPPAQTAASDRSAFDAAAVVAEAEARMKAWELEQQNQGSRAGDPSDGGRAGPVQGSGPVPNRWQRDPNQWKGTR